MASQGLGGVFCLEVTFHERPARQMVKRLDVDLFEATGQKGPDLSHPIDQWATRAPNFTSCLWRILLSPSIRSR
jgi:hypothetical protein